MRCFLFSIPVVSYRFLPQEEVPALLKYDSVVQRKYTPKISDVPYHVLVVYGNSFCSGSLISSITVLTAASCFWRYTGQDVVVKAGTNVISEDANVYGVRSIKIHEYYKHRSDMDNDIALLLLIRHVTFSEALKKVILIEPETAVREHAPLIVSGWSTVKLAPKFGNVLLWSEMIVIDRQQCIDTYKGFISPSNFCAKFNLERRLYDNGGPAVLQDFLVGIMSFGAMKIYITQKIMVQSLVAQLQGQMTLSCCVRYSSHRTKFISLNSLSILICIAISFGILANRNKMFTEKFITIPL